MNDLSQTLKKGTLLIIETGEYSDRGWAGPVKLTKDYVKADLAEAYKREWKPEGKWDDKPGPDGFLPWLVKSGRAVEVDTCHAWHVGSYGAFEPE